MRHNTAHRLGSQRLLAASLAQLGRLEEAKAEAAQFLAAHPLFSIRQWASTQPFRHETDRQRFVDGYLKAGPPMRGWPANVGGTIGLSAFRNPPFLASRRRDVFRPAIVDRRREVPG